MEEGIIPGGGALIRSIPALLESKNKFRSDKKVAVHIIEKALEAPLRQIAENTGIDGAVIVDEEKGKTIGYDANTKQFADMFTAGITDPTKVARIALQNAASIAGLMLPTNTMITELKESEEEEGEFEAIEGSVY